MLWDVRLRICYKGGSDIPDRTLPVEAPNIQAALIEAERRVREDQDHGGLYSGVDFTSVNPHKPTRQVGEVGPTGQVGVG